MKANPSPSALVPFTIFIGCIIIFTCCKKKDKSSDTPFQGPKNGSFEIAGDIAQRPAGWVNNIGYNDQAVRVTGTGFLPSQGVWFENLYVSTLTAELETNLFQDSVDLTHSTKLSFDYVASGTINTGMVTIRLLFTSNGTLTLWADTLTSVNVLPLQKLNETVVLPSTIIPGRLILLMDAYKSSGSTNDVPGLAFAVDNIKVN